MVRRRSRNRYVEIFDQDMASMPLVAEGYLCAKCGMPLLVKPWRDPTGRYVHPDCDATPGVGQVAEHLLMHAGKELGLTPKELREVVDSHALNRIVDMYIRDWTFIRDRWRRTPPDTQPKPVISYVQLVVDLVQNRPMEDRPVAADRPAHQSAAHQAAAYRAELQRVCQELIRQLTRRGTLRPVYLATNCSAHAAAKVLTELGDLVSRGEVPASGTGAFTFRVSADHADQAAERLRSLRYR